MNILFLVLLLLFQLFYFTSSFVNKSDKRYGLLQNDYEYVLSRDWFYKFHKIHRTWVEARDLCALEWAFLWYPQNKEDVADMLTFWKDRHPYLLKLHVGISKQGQWKTVDGKLRDEIWNKWAPGDPCGSLGEDCAAIRRDFYLPRKADLIDDNCNSLKPFICKKVRASIDWDHYCNMPNKKYIFNPELSRCYKFHSTPVSWNKAHSICEAEHSSMAVIDSEKEKEFLMKIFANALTEKFPWINVDVIQVHVGFHNQYGEGWKTLSGTPLDESGFMVWGHNPPEGGENLPCGTLFFDGVLNDVNCNKPKYFICEHDINSRIN